MFKKKEKNKGKPAASPTPVQQPDKKQLTAQEFVPIRDINHGLIYRKDHSVVGVIRIYPINISLLSTRERYRKVKQLEEVINGFEHQAQIISIAKPVNLDTYISELEQIKQEQLEKGERIHARLLNGYIQQAAFKATSGEALERHFYMLFSKKLSNKNATAEAQELLNMIHEIALQLVQADLKSHVCNDSELRDLQFIFHNQGQAMFERAPENNHQLPPVLFSPEVYTNGT